MRRSPCPEQNVLKPRVWFSRERVQKPCSGVAAAAELSPVPLFLSPPCQTHLLKA